MRFIKTQSIKVEFKLAVNLNVTVKVSCTGIAANYRNIEQIENLPCELILLIYE